MALSSKGCFKIGNTEYKPKSLKITYDSLATSNSGRSDNGTMVINWVRKNIRKIEIEMPPMSASALSSLLAAVSGQTYTITIFDPKANAEAQISVYTSNSQADCYSGVIHNGLYQGVQFSAIEV